MVRWLAAIAVALAGCATAPPPPVQVSEREIGALRVQLAGMPNVAAPASAYQVSA